MSEQVSVAGIAGVSETLLIPLVGRAMAGRLYPKLGFADPAAEEILKKISFNPARFAASRTVVRGGAIRAMIFDRMARGFFEKYPDGLGVSLGAGLDTRFNRIDNGRLRWVDIDLPDVIAVKRQLLKETGRYRMLACSAFDPVWFGEIGRRPGEPLIVVSEGMLLYFGEAEIKGLFAGMLGAWPEGFEICFDYCHPLLARNSRKFTEVKSASARFKWGVKRPEDIERWDSRLQLVGVEPITQKVGGLPGAAAWLFRRLSGLNAYAAAHFRARPR